MEDWKKAAIPLDATIRDAVENLNTAGIRLCVVVDPDWRAEGVVTDGDIRRALLAGHGLESPVRDVMCTSFYSAKEDDDDEKILLAMTQKKVRQVPILDKDGQIVGIKTMMGMMTTPEKDNWVVLMAGGRGTRLMPLTSACPKPLLSVGGQPILEIIMKQFINAGFRRFYISVNYCADMITDYFGDGSRFGVEIRYLHEDKPLGTAGALSLLPEQPAEPVFVMNGDLLTKIDLPRMLNFHTERGAAATMAVRTFDMQVPYGVVTVEGDRIDAIEEKPIHSFFVNGGIYVLDPGTIANDIPHNEYLDMPTLFTKLMDTERNTAAFPVHEYWMDIGQRQDFDQANIDYLTHFNGVED